MRFLEEAEEDVLGRLSASEQESFSALRRARVEKNYVQVPQKLFLMLLQVYEGMEVADIFRNNERGNAEEANKLMQEFHINLTSVMEARRFRHRLKLPDIRAVSLD
jgi:WD40 repeat protein